MFDRMLKLRGYVTDAPTMPTIAGIPRWTERLFEEFFNICPFPNVSDMQTLSQALITNVNQPFAEPWCMFFLLSSMLLH